MENNTLEFWEMRWQHQQTGWDLGVISPPMKKYIDGIDDKNQRILIPGCGNAHEAVYLLEKGFTNVTIIDIAPSLTSALTNQLQTYIARQKLTVVCGDFFEHKGAYDLILEQTFFCAIPPSMRGQYAQHMKELLVPGGHLVGLLFDKTFEGGPPFGGSIKEYEGFFNPVFQQVSIHSCSNSAKPRAGSEVWIELLA
jgi:SAM-dependent methyltransferase